LRVCWLTATAGAPSDCECWLYQEDRRQGFLDAETGDSANEPAVSLSSSGEMSCILGVSECAVVEGECLTRAKPPGSRMNGLRCSTGCEAAGRREDGVGEPSRFVTSVAFARRLVGFRSLHQIAC
jgi:hypothetical protein